MPGTISALNLTDKCAISSSRYSICFLYPIYLDPQLRYDSTFTSRIYYFNLAYSAAAKPRPSAKKN